MNRNKKNQAIQNIDGIYNNNYHIFEKSKNPT